MFLRFLAADLFLAMSLRLLFGTLIGGCHLRTEAARLFLETPLGALLFLQLALLCSLFTLGGFLAAAALGAQGIDDQLKLAAAQVFAAVRAAYAALKIPRDWADSANGQLGTLRMRANNALGGELLSTYFNCGQGITGPNADQWRLQLAIVTFVQPAGDGKSRLGTGVAAEAQDMSGVSTAPAMCGSSGLLEARILKEVRARLGAP